MKRSAVDLPLEFETTDDLSQNGRVIGQERALRAIDFGLHIFEDGYNLYISGMPGTGRSTTVMQLIEKAAIDRPTPPDICYLFNFSNNDEPRSLLMPAGKGCEFHRDMEDFIKDLESEIKKAFHSDDYEKHKKQIMESLNRKEEDSNQELQGFAEQKGLSLQQTLTGLVIVPQVDGEPVDDQKFEKLPSEQKERIRNDRQEVYKKLYDISRRMRLEQRTARKRLKKLDEQVALNAIGGLIDELRKKYGEYDDINRYLDDIKSDVLKELDLFKKEQKEDQLAIFGGPKKDKQDILNKYRVNVLVDNGKTKGAPVITEHNPTYYNITGYVEYQARFGLLITDFTMIKPGAVHKASGGFLVVEANQILRDYFAWDSLKKMIRYRNAKIENLAQKYGYAPTTGIKPQPVPVDLKVVMIGNPYIYQLLYVLDEDFRKLFKVKVDFDTIFNRSDEINIEYAHFVARKAREGKMLPFTRPALLEIIEYGSRLAEHKHKVSARFLDILDVIKEADFWAKRDEQARVGPEYVKKALEEKHYRSNMIQDHVRDLISEGTIFIDREPTIGQVTGLSIIDLGDYRFGRPSRLTVKTFFGKAGVVNIERETNMSGPIHSKGVLILSGYLGWKFAQDKPLALSAGIVFEQNYSGVDGDSASSAELYALLSDLAELPLRQDVAVTGSVDQRGQVQPIGGVNDKIEGYFLVCKTLGLTGKQGVIIPEANIKNLMLKEEVINAVREGMFHIYPVKTIEQGIEILTGKPAGTLLSGGGYTSDTVYQLVDRKLSRFSRLAAEFGRGTISPPKQEEHPVYAVHSDRC